MKSIFVLSQNIVFENIYKLKSYFDINTENIIISTCKLFPNEIKLFNDIGTNNVFITFSDLLSDSEMEKCDELAFKDGKCISHDQYVNNVRFEKNKLVFSKICNMYPKHKGYLISDNNDLGICDYIWIKAGYHRISFDFYYHEEDKYKNIKQYLKSNKFVVGMYRFIHPTKKPILNEEDIHVYDDKGYKYIIIGKLDRIGYRIDKEFAMSKAECDRINSGNFYKRRNGQYLIPWHEHFKNPVPDTPEYDVRWVQDGYLPSNYSDFTYSFKPNNVIYDVWDSIGGQLFKNKALPYEGLPFRKKLHLPYPKFPTQIKTILVATSATGDWTALKNRSDDDILVETFLEVARRRPDINIIYRCHPNWILPNTVGVNSINRVIKYLVDCNIPNMAVSSNIPNAMKDDGYIQTFSRASLSEDLKKADIVFGEHSISMIDAGFKCKPFASVNVTKRRNLFNSINSLGFPYCENVDDIVSLLFNIENIDFQNKYLSAIDKYNEMVDAEI